MPHGFQWSPEDYRNAERAARIQAQAIIEAQRKEQARLEQETRIAPRREPTRTPPPRPTCSDFTLRQAYRAAEVENTQAIAKMRAEKALRATFGSAEYIHNRYGHVVWCGKITEYRNKFGCSEEEAIVLMVRDYSESSWAHLEDPLIEGFMGHRR